jgi:hypothetical protein
MNRILLKSRLLFLVVFLFISGCATQQVVRTNSYNHLNLEIIKAGKFDTGKMWTFDFPPTEYFAKTYNFTPTKEWFDKARLSALRLPNCTAFFVSEDGLVLSNHHCARSSLDSVSRDGEKLAEDGFYASTLDEERKVPDLFIDQLVVMEDVTNEVQEAFNSGVSEYQKMSNKMLAISEIQDRYEEKYKKIAPQDSMVFKVVEFYNGGRYSLYGYKRYTDIRLVFAPEEVMAFFGGDPDNFTYPRYDFDCSMFRIYENGKPLKTSNYFRFNPAGAKDSEAVFVVGNPGRTSRLLTIAQLEYLRDYVYPNYIETYTRIGSIYSEYVKENPEAKLKYMNTIFGLENSRKAVTGYLEGLKDRIIMAKKKDFENKFKAAVKGNPELNREYGDPWSEISKYQAELNSIYDVSNAFSFRGRSKSKVFILASDIVDFAVEQNSSEEFMPRHHSGNNRDSSKIDIYPKNFVPEIEEKILAFQMDIMDQDFNGDNQAFNKLLAGRTPEQAAGNISKSSILFSKEKTMELLSKSPEEILSSTDPIIEFVAATRQQARELKIKSAQLQEKLKANVQILGKALYAVYDTQIPPDATFTLRIADGVVKGYDYNGTIAPPVTTFYGLYDRYYSFGEKAPWNLSQRWINPPSSFKLSTPMNFVSTNDIIGGNSGSPVVNKDLQVVGLIFDGNIESLAGNIIYDDTKNRSVAVHSAAILEGLDKIYKAERIVRELEAGKISR